MLVAKDLDQSLLCKTGTAGIHRILSKYFDVYLY